MQYFFNAMGINWMPLLMTALTGYFLGSLNFAIISTRIFKSGEIRQQGSGNAGITNVLRSAGVKPALLTLAGDLLKAVCAVLVARAWFVNFGAGNEPFLKLVPAFTAGLFCVIGHVYPCYFSFKGGKGVLAAAGIYLFVDWRVFLVVIAAFVLLVIATKYVSLGSVVAASLLPFVTFFMHYFIDFKDFSGYPFSLCVYATGISAIIGFIIVFKHKENIKRLIKGEEKKFSVKK